MQKFSIRSQVLDETDEVTAEDVRFGEAVPVKELTPNTLQRLGRLTGGLGKALGRQGALGRALTRNRPGRRPIQPHSASAHTYASEGEGRRVRSPERDAVGEGLYGAPRQQGRTVRFATDVAAAAGRSRGLHEDSVDLLDESSRLPAIADAEAGGGGGGAARRGEGPPSEPVDDVIDALEDVIETSEGSKEGSSGGSPRPR